MIDRKRLDRVLADIEESNDGLPAHLCRDVADLLQVHDVTLALIGGPSRRVTLGASSSNALSLDNWQFTLDEGPCLDAAGGGRSTSGLLTAPETPWPLLAARASELGYDTIAGIPLAISGRVFGAMNLQAHAGEFGKETIGNAEEVAKHLAGPLVGLLAESAPDVIDVGDHDTVHQAVGMVSAQMEIGTSDALAVLRAHAWTEGRHLIRIAEQVVRRELAFELSKHGGG